MLLEQLPTSSSSSSPHADSDNKETSPQAHMENPSPLTPTAAPLPEVDEEAQRRLTRILRSMPSDLDPTTAYATLKARLGISLSKDRATTSTPPNPPSSQTQAPLRTPEPTPFVPLVPYGGDDSEEEEGAQAAAAPTLLEQTQPIEVVNIDDDSLEDLLPPPNEILQQRGADWTFIPNAEDESVPDREEEPLRRRSRRTEVNRVVREVEAMVADMQRTEDAQVGRPHEVRSILDEQNEFEFQGAVGAINQ